MELFLSLVPLFFAFFLLIQVLFWSGIASRLLSFSLSPKSTVRPSVSVIICTHNEASNLEILLPKLISQIYDYFEVILVNDRSADTTEEVFRKIAGRYPNFRHLRIDTTPEGWNSKKFALDTGIRAASGDLILLTDADCIPDSDHWIDKMQQELGPSAQIVLGYSPYYKKSGLLSTFIRFETLYTAIQYLSFAKVGLPYMGVGRNLAYRKELYVKSNALFPYRSVRGGDDDLFIGATATAKNTTISISPEAVVWSQPKTTYSEWFRQKHRHMNAGKYYSFRHKIVAGLLPFSHIGLYIFLIFSLFTPYKWPIIAVFILRTVLFIVIFGLIGKKLKDRFNVLEAMTGDISFPLLYILIGTYAVLFKRARWN